MCEIYPYLKLNSKYKSVFKLTIKQFSVSRIPNLRREAPQQEETEGRKLSFINAHTLMNYFFGNPLFTQSNTEFSAQ